MSDRTVFLERDRVIENVISQMRASRSEECMRERLMNLEESDVCPVLHDTRHIQFVIDDIVRERRRQLAIWGEQSDNTQFEWMSILGEEFGELCQAVNETNFRNAAHSERGGYNNMYMEAIQVAAVAAAFAESVADAFAKSVLDDL